MTGRMKAGTALAAAVIGSGAAIGIASVPDGNGVVHACYEVAPGGTTVPSGSPGNVRVIDPGAAQTCDAASEHAFTIGGQPGPQGPPGMQGPPGPQGPPGTAATVEVAPQEATAGQGTLNVRTRATRSALAIAGSISFPVLSVGYGVSGPGAKTSGYVTRAAPPPKVIVTREPDKYTTALFKACATGEHFKTMVFELFKNGTTTPYLKLTLTDAVVTSAQAAGHVSDHVQETEEFAAQKLTLKYLGGASHTLPAIQYSSTAKTKLKFPG
jgi:type VI secretion system Hcp family effector